MKILVPIDFSEASVNAAEWTAFLFEEEPYIEIELLHVVNLSRRAGMFYSMDDILLQRADEDLKQLSDRIAAKMLSCKLKRKVLMGDTKSVIKDYLNALDFDLVVMGTSGMGGLEKRLMGSSTRALIHRTSVPILAIPPSCKFRFPRTISLGVDLSKNSKPQELSFLRRIVSMTQADLHLVHVRTGTDEQSDFEKYPSDYLDATKLNFHSASLKSTVASTLMAHVSDQGSDLLCLVHEDRSWLMQFVDEGVSVAELKNLSVPLLILRAEAIIKNGIS